MFRIVFLCLLMLTMECAEELVHPAKAPVVLLKLDDVVTRTERWDKTAKFIEEEGLKANFGVINSGLENPSPKLVEWMKGLAERKVIEFWCHGYDARFVHDADHKGEFEGSGYDLQLKALTRSQELAKKWLGSEYSAFGPHWSGTDPDTDKALEEVPGIKVLWFYGPKPGSTSTKVVVERRMELEVPLFKPNAQDVQRKFEAKGHTYDYIALQGHPNQWDEPRFAEFQTAVRYLKGQGCRFMLVSDWLAERVK